MFHKFILSVVVAYLCTILSLFALPITDTTLVLNGTNEETYLENRFGHNVTTIQPNNPSSLITTTTDYLQVNVSNKTIDLSYVTENDQDSHILLDESFSMISVPNHDLSDYDHMLFIHQQREETSMRLSKSYTILFSILALFLVVSTILSCFIVCFCDRYPLKRRRSSVHKMDADLEKPNLISNKNIVPSPPPLLSKSNIREHYVNSKN
ncbi:unnamed protein product [Didymodactylos carnosus]|uniref:Uncharacterized protein n=1 Tax=Didymodactylos carnosus TaxID=1234261 RepID=A0A815FZ02_9BILA|nr:unnamed protein product [Didymodactylos carnosus]CAF1331739.1 unnamed protein product [Didymodactylos carnosus]CAF3858611.1 unnamed protein product [Didymodactylos carnosus]CAF4185765.1 unnamed protein product [Didymodactylos carnosus]